MSLNEGGTKTAAFVSGPKILKKIGQESNEYGIKTIRK